MLLTRKGIFIWIAAISLIFVLWSFVGLRSSENQANDSNNKIQEIPTYIVERVTIKDDIPMNSAFRVSKESKAYTVNPNISCFAYGCDELNNRKAFGPCENEEATEWLILGVHKMVRYLNGDIVGMPDYNRNSLLDAEVFFEKALELDQSCPQAYINLGFVKLALEKYEDAPTLFETVCGLIK